MLEIGSLNESMVSFVSRRYMRVVNGSLVVSEMPLRTDEKSGNVGRTFPDFHFYRLKGEITHKERLFLHLECLELLWECYKIYSEMALRSCLFE